MMYRSMRTTRSKKDLPQVSYQAVASYVCETEFNNNQGGMPSFLPRTPLSFILGEKSSIFYAKSFSQGQPTLSNTSRNSFYPSPLSQLVPHHCYQPHALSYSLPAQGAQMTTVSAIFFEISAKIRPKNVF